MGKPEQCSQTVFGERVTSWQCTRDGSIERGGKWYCCQHDPKQVEKRKKERQAKWDAEWAAKEKKWKRKEAIPRLAKKLAKSALATYAYAGLHSTARKLLKVLEK